MSNYSLTDLRSTNCMSCKGQQWELPQDAHKTQNIQHLHDETLTLPIQEHLQLHASQYKQKTQHPSHPLHKHTTYFNTPRFKNPLSLTTNRPPHSHYNRHKKKHALYTYVDCLPASPQEAIRNTAHTSTTH